MGMRGASEGHQRGHERGSIGSMRGAREGHESGHERGHERGTAVAFQPAAFQRGEHVAAYQGMSGHVRARQGHVGACRGVATCGIVMSMIIEHNC